jgi:superfamily II DNA or RNA helicase
MSHEIPALRPYQSDVIQRFHGEIAAGKKRIMLVAPTGSGKTVIASAIVNEAIAAGKRVLLFSHRREITKQTCEKLFALGIDAGVIQAGWPPRPGQAVQVASVQTLTARAIRTSAVELPRADIVIVDEAHHSPAETYRKVLAAYPEAIVLGLTATPCRKDGRGLGNIFDCIIECPQIAELIRLEYLVPTVIYAPATPDLRGVRTQAGDYVESQLAERLNTAELVGDIVGHWLRLAEHRPTVVFATNVAHSIHIRDEFQRAGIAAEHIDGSTPVEERDAILKRLAQGEIEVVSNCAVLTEGWNCPEVSCLVLARPTKSLGLFRQMIGRGLRPSEGKRDCLILDHAGAVFQHGLPEDEILWTLQADKKAANPKHLARTSQPSSRLCKCPKCAALRTAGEGCRSCGWEPKRRGEAVEVIDGDLALVGRDRRVHAHEYSSAERDRWHSQLIWYADLKGYRPGWAARQFKDKFGSYPPWGAAVTPLPASPEVLSWIRSRQIAYAKAMAKQRGAA